MEGRDANKNGPLDETGENSSYVGITALQH